MTHGLLYKRARFLILVGALAAAAVVGCDSSTYPEHLKYPARSDLLVQKPKASDALDAAGNRRPLAPPGHLDESIESAANPSAGEAPFEWVNPTKVPKDERDDLNAALREIFGTPAYPTMEPTAPRKASEEIKKEVETYKKVYDQAFARGLTEFGATQEDVENLLLDDRTLRKGSELYRRHCLHCHGVAGDGRGPTGPWVNPYPRDYRQGLFKFISTDVKLRPRKPRRDDLLRTLAKGIDGTSMPAFGLLPQRELEQLASYVTHLSIRGEVEYQTLWAAEKNKQAIGDARGIKGFAYQMTGELLAQWGVSNAKKPTAPPPYDANIDKDKAAVQESIRRGHQLFLGKGICITCHYDYGRQSAYRYDEWGTLVKPRNLTEGVFRGGRRPVDIFWRISGGIVPSGMSQLPDGMSEQEVWDIVNFVQNIPYPAMLPSDVREKVYGPAEKKKTGVARVDP